MKIVGAQTMEQQTVEPFCATAIDVTRELTGGTFEEIHLFVIGKFAPRCAHIVGRARDVCSLDSAKESLTSISSDKHILMLPCSPRI